MLLNSEFPFFVSIPHSGEKIPAEVTWLEHLNEPTLMRDVDRFVDKLYAPVIQEMGISAVITDWHRYVVDLNRTPDQIDKASVEGATHPKGTYPKGLHWSVTTHEEVLIERPMSLELHQQIVAQYYQPFHDGVKALGVEKKAYAQQVFHLDLHSMPSVGTRLHSDPGEQRAEVVISDYHGKSSIPEYKDIVMKAYQEAGFQVSYNWPYVGGGITQLYGQPENGHNTIQVELNRALYMDETTKKLNEQNLNSIQSKLSVAIHSVISGLQGYLND